MMRVIANGQLTSAGARGLIALLAVALAAFSIVHWDRLSADLTQSFGRLAGGDAADTSLKTTIYELAIERVPAPADPGQGGAIAALGDDVLLVTRRGDFFRLNADTKRFDPIDIAPPAPVTTSGVYYRRAKDFASLGYRDLLLQPADDGIDALLSQALIDRDRMCVAVAIWRMTIPVAAMNGAGADDADGWRRVWESSPCIGKNHGSSFPLQAGGDMAVLPDGRLAIFVGDFGVDGYNRISADIDPQTGDNDYGKVIAIDLTTGAAEHLSRGHRNPGGLLVGRDGAIWQSENAAQGGDEVNRIIVDGNYGWPLETYGVHYGTNAWPLDDTVGDHDRFVRPIFAFVPSIAVSSLDEMTGAEFPAWEGDLILGALKYQRLVRLHIREGRVIFAEPMPLGVRVRDLTIDSAGRIYVKADEQPYVLRITNSHAPAPAAGSLAAAFAAAGCAACHDGPAPTAPTLADLYGRPIASVRGFDYSEALEQRRGAWTSETLSAYLADPQSFAPGTTMPAPDISAEQANALIAALEGQTA